MNNRIVWIDWARIIGMYAIILGHFFPYPGSGFVYSFSVPLFFFISGYLTKECSCLLIQAWDKIWTSLVAPALIFLLINWFVFLSQNDFTLSWETVIDPWLRTIRGRFAPLMGGMWFVVDLAIIRFILLVSPRRFIRILGVCSLVLMYVLYKLEISEASLQINIWGGFFFVWIGNEIKRFSIIKVFLESFNGSFCQWLFRVGTSLILMTILFFSIDDSLYII